jgi:hypothetical protein
MIYDAVYRIEHQFNGEAIERHFVLLPLAHFGEPDFLSLDEAKGRFNPVNDPDRVRQHLTYF